MTNLFFSILCVSLLVAGNIALAQDKDDKPLVAKPLVAKPVESDTKEKLDKKEESKKEKADKKPKESDKKDKGSDKKAAEPDGKAEKSDKKMSEKSEGDDPKDKEGDDEGGKKEGMDRLGELFVEAWKPGVKLSGEEYAEFMKLLPLMLPGKDFLGDDLEWRLLFRDAEETGNDLVTVNLSKKGSDPYAREMFFQINYNTNFAEDSSNKAFEGYHSFSLPGVHQMVLIGHIEIRAVAAADLYKSQKKIEDVLKAFPLKKIEKL